MAGLLRYLLLANLFLVIMALFYHLVLSKETRFKTNRFILISGTFLSLILPLFQLSWFPVGSYSILTIPEIIVYAKSGITHINIDEIQIFGKAPFSFPWLRFLGTIYIAGSMFMGIALIWKIKKLQLWTRQYPMKWFKNLYITIMPGNWSPFSFLGVVYFPSPLDKLDKSAQLILEHEKVHVRQKHGWDIIFIELIKILFFYNPAIYTVKKQIQINHEYLADSAVVGEELKSYSQELIRIQLQVPKFQFIQQFNQASLLKRRILMLMKSKSNSSEIVKYLLLLPLIGGLLWLNACTDEAEPQMNAQLIERTSSDYDLDKSNSVTEMVSRLNHKLDTDNELNEEIFDIVDEMPEFSGEGLAKFSEWVNNNVQYPNIAVQNGISGTVYVNFVVDKLGEISIIKITKGVDPSLDDEVRRVLKSAPSWTPGMIEGKNVNVSMEILVKFTL